MSSITNIFLRESNLIGGDWLPGDNSSTIPVSNPATGSTIGVVPDSGRSETRRAITAAVRTFSTFSRTTAMERSTILREMASIMLKNQGELAELLTLEMGKPLAESIGEIAIGAQYLNWFAEEARRIYGDLVPSPWVDRRIMVRHEPVGVVGAITPWNFPSSMLARKIGPAIAAGCTSVIKPAIQTPYSGLAWGVIGEMAGLPSGVLNIVTGDAGTIGKEICSNSDVAKLTFTGSTSVGKLLIRQSASSVKKLSMELGGNAPFIVFNSADIDSAVEGAIAAKYRNSGQTCVCTNRFYVQSKVYKEFVEKFADRASSLKVGSGMDDGVQQGPLIDESAVKKVEYLIADAISKGGKIITGGNRHSLGGTFFEPTVISNGKRGMKATKEEIFGPLSIVYKFTKEEDAIARANDTRYGLACYFYTSDLGQAFRVMEGLEYGLVGVNEGIITTPEAPFGGMKESGLGSEGGRQGIEEYLNTKYVCLGGLGI